MPAESKAQQALFAIAEHHPEKLNSPAKQRLAKLPRKTLHEFAATPTKGLPKRVPTAQARIRRL